MLGSCLLACATPKASEEPSSTLPAAQSGAPTALMSEPYEYAIEAASSQAGEGIFTRTGIGDPYRTGVPYPIFLALLEAYPEDLGPDLPTFVRRFGFLARERDANSEDPDLRAGLPVGMHLTTDPFTSVPFLVTNCTLCHAERLHMNGEERLVVGLGNKRVRLHAYDAAWSRLGERTDLSARALAPLAEAAAEREGLIWEGQWAPVFVEASIGALRERARTRRAFLERVEQNPPGLVAVIESFALAMEQTLGRAVPTGARVGWAKVPDVIGYAQRSTLSFDAAGAGPKDALVVEADFAAGARLEWFWAHPLQGASLSAYLNQLSRELPFPGTIDGARAERGKQAFQAACSPCHGEYAADGRATRYEEKVIPVRVVGSDSARAEAVTEDYARAGSDPKLTHGLVRVRRTLGYVPPVLTDVWARAPYGHAGQWSSLDVLAQAPSERATRYVMDLSGALDLTRVGVPVRQEHGSLGAHEVVIDAAQQTGRSVSGHPFLSDLPASTRGDVVEYLKTL
ncbi:MAG: hypothetical protein QM778_31585 [Myxococcales bacterium]